MTITISPALEVQVRERASAEGLSVDSYVERLISDADDNAWPEIAGHPDDENSPEFEDVRAAVMEGLDQLERGETMPARQAFAELRAKHGIQR